MVQLKMDIHASYVDLTQVPHHLNAPVMLITRLLRDML